jgi:hypothetical protein
MATAAVARTRKPRTNAEAAAHWADGILSHSPSYAITVNSVICEGDTIYSFGHHFPMAKMIRDSRGRVVKVALNSDHWNRSGGFGNTSGDQWNVKAEVAERAAKATWKIAIVSLPLSDYSAGRLRLRPPAGDPEPDPYPQTVVPTYFHSYYPGDEPVDTNAAKCLAGQREEYSYAEEVMLYEWESRNQPGDWVLRQRPRGGVIVERWANGVILYGSEPYNYADGDEANTTYKQCPHCKEFNARHDRWSGRMNGWYSNDHPNGWGRASWQKGWLEYHANMVKFGSEKAWREGRRADFRRVKRLRKVRADWEARNYVSLIETPIDKHGLPLIDADGFVARGTVERQRRRRARQAKIALAARVESRRRPSQPDDPPTASTRLELTYTVV